MEKYNLGDTDVDERNIILKEIGVCVLDSSGSE
jgi:hypothetical protein